MNANPEDIIDIAALKQKVKEYVGKLSEDKDLQGNFEELRDALKAEVTTIDQKKAAEIAKEREMAALREKETASASEAADKDEAKKVKELLTLKNKLVKSVETSNQVLKDMNATMKQIPNKTWNMQWM